MLKENSLQTRILKSLFFSFTIPVLFILIFLFFIMYYSFNKIEKERQENILENFYKRIYRDIDNFSNLIRDWVDYEQPVLYLQNKYPEFSKEELPVSVKDINFQLFVSITKDNKVKEILFFDKNGKLIPTPQEIINFFKNNPIKHITSRDKDYRGFIRLKNYPLYFVARGVLIYQDNYKNSYGTFVFGRIIDEDLLKIYSNDIGFPVHIIPVNDSQYKEFQKDHFLKTESFQLNRGYILINDFYNKPIFYIQIDFPRNLFAQSLIYFGILGSIILILNFISLLILNKNLQKILLNRIFKLVEEVIYIKQNPEKNFSISIDKENDEISLLQTHINQMLEKISELNEINQTYTKLLEIEKQKAEELLLNILPEPIAERLSNPTSEDREIIADNFPNTTVLFADIVNFTSWSKEIDPEKLVQYLNDIFSEFDLITEKYNIEKIKTIGDNYMAAAGIPTEDEYHADNMIRFALEMLEKLKNFNKKNKLNLKIRIGINSGKVVAGVIGKKKFIYDIWGDTVNIASRMESWGLENQIQISENTFNAIKDESLKKLFKKRGKLKLKSGHKIDIYILEIEKSLEKIT
ncbi:MAG: hypothetical protein KatS3mg129_2281 [Leptospiraceae bacterium]|nr:MAG: hypothetical protein KatS3mg129_2281 [Leptospiraceae bacterium]